MSRSMIVAWWEVAEALRWSRIGLVIAAFLVGTFVLAAWCVLPGAASLLVPDAARGPVMAILYLGSAPLALGVYIAVLILMCAPRRRRVLAPRRHG